MIKKGQWEEGQEWEEKGVDNPHRLYLIEELGENHPCQLKMKSRWSQASSLTMNYHSWLR